MTATPDRPGIDQLTSDQLDRLYARLDKAERAEATLTAVRKLHRPANDWSWKTFGCDHGGAHTQLCSRCKTCYPCATVAVLDQHGQTPT
ncbi:hypothetical protein ACIQ9R_37485 [Streptomyces sp. NPDC094447]|uniref:hypothetical protein n=1 Tax=Streptomyces sp. NPDC094447 TaxID=3366062 RepID=UPI0038130BC1